MERLLNERWIAIKSVDLYSILIPNGKVVQIFFSYTPNTWDYFFNTTTAQQYRTCAVFESKEEIVYWKALIKS